jgi:hypothetical protein
MPESDEEAESDGAEPKAEPSQTRRRTSYFRGKRSIGRTPDKANATRSTPVAIQPSIALHHFPGRARPPGAPSALF